MKNKKKLLISLFLAIVLLTFIFVGKNIVQAYYMHKNSLLTVFSMGKINANVTELNKVDNQIIKPNEEILKKTSLSNTGTIDEYLRAQIYIPIAKQKYIDNNENVVEPDEEIDLFIYEYNLGEGWQRVTDKGFSGIVEDDVGNKYRLYTYKYIENGKEKVIKSGETIKTPVFDKIKAINYLDIENSTNFKIITKAIAIQNLDGKTSEQMWQYYLNQNTGEAREVN